MNDLPHSSMDLDAFETEAELCRRIGFVPSREFTRTEDATLFGIAHRRGIMTPQAERVAIAEQVAPDAADAALAKTPEIEKDFREAFPFLTQ